MRTALRFTRLLLTAATLACGTAACALEPPAPGSSAVSAAPAAVFHVTTPAATSAAPQTLGRPRIGLVLSGGGARGLAHVGVLKMLEREHIAIDVIAGTSMGAIIGGLYASGMHAEQLERELLAVNWDAVFASRVDRPLLAQRRKEDDFELSPALEFGMRDGELRAPLGALSGRGLESLLRRYTLPVRGLRDFAQLSIPFRAVATDLETGAAVILGSGDLALALRSSMSVPGVFAPTEADERILGDGGLVNNLPVDVARAMGADIVIAVNVASPLATRAELGSVGGLTAQMISILTEQNLQRSLASLRPSDVLITPQLGRLDASDFTKVRALIDLGDAGAQPQAARLRCRWRRRRTRNGSRHATRRSRHPPRWRSSASRARSGPTRHGLPISSSRPTARCSTTPKQNATRNGWPPVATTPAPTTGWSARQKAMGWCSTSKTNRGDRTTFVSAWICSPTFVAKALSTSSSTTTGAG
jgi:predicted acylesterase/phospholipase RssA